MFYSLYHKEINENCNEISQFTSFKNILFTEIEDYFNKIKNTKINLEIGDFGFFTDSIKKVRINPTL